MTFTITLYFYLTPILYLSMGLYRTTLPSEILQFLWFLHLVVAEQGFESAFSSSTDI